MKTSNLRGKILQWRLQLRMINHCSFFFSEFTPPVWFLCFTSFNHSLLIVNASCNFLIYCSVGAKFKTTISKFFARWGICPHPAMTSPTNACGGMSAAARDSPLPMIVLAKQVCCFSIFFRFWMIHFPWFSFFTVSNNCSRLFHIHILMLYLLHRTLMVFA